jgi:two-component system OmpR family sensor kinase
MLARLAVRNWSLRARLLAGVVLLVAIALATTGTVGVALLRSYLVHQVDQQLNVGVVAISRGPSGRPPPVPRDSQLPTPFVFADLAPNGTTVRVRGGSLQPGDPQPNFSGITAATVRRHTGQPFTIPSTGGGAGFRVRAVSLTGGSEIGVVAISLQPVDATVHRLEFITVMVALGVLAVLVALGTVAVRIALRPLATVERTAEEIAAGNLSRRVPAGPPGTEIGRLARALNAMLAQIESGLSARRRSESALRQFIADASHELRTPLTTVRGYAELARKGALPDEAERAKAMSRIEAEASRMGGLVDDLLLLAYLDQERPLNLAKIDLRGLAADAVADARVRAPDREITFSAPDGAVFVDTDADRTRQVLNNLLGNALTHTPDGTPVQVSLRQDGAQVRLEVADEGPGLEPEQVARLFERFYRVDASRSRARGGSGMGGGTGGGTGLGLAIVQAIVQASHGTVTCTSRPGAGTSFVVTLPAHSAHPADVQRKCRLV